MRKLLIVSSDTVHVYNYLKLIEGYFDEILLLSNRKNPNYSFPVQVLDFSFKNPLNYLFTIRRIRKIAKEFNPDVVHVHQANSYAYFTFKALRKTVFPKVLTTWGSDILLNPTQSKSLKKIVQYVISESDVISSDSTFMADEIERLVPQLKKEILIANFGINVETLDLTKENIIYSNRLHKSLYRIDKIILSFSKFLTHTAHQTWKLVIAGSGEETDHLKSLVNSLNLQNKVQFIGWVDSKTNSEFYAKSRIFVSIPESDATSISLLEAMHFGCLPIVSDLPANREWIKDGVNGIIAENLGSDIFSQALSMDFEKAIEINKTIIEQHATKKVNRKKFLDMYDKLLEL